MSSGTRRGTRLAVAAVAIPAVGSSAALVHKFIGVGGLVAYLLISVCCIMYAPTFVGAVISRSQRECVALAGGLLVLAIVAYASLHSHVAHWSPGPGSDRGDALNRGTQSLIDLRYPYSQTTYLGNPISQFPGAMILAVPFVALLGSAAYATFFWAAASFAALARVFGAGPTLAAFVVVVVFTPAIAHDIATGGDLVANGCAVLAPAVLLLSPRPSTRWSVALAILLGLALAWRPNLAVVLPLLLVVLVRRGEIRRGWIVLLATVGAALGATLPFYLDARERFGPSLAAGQFFAGPVPHAESLTVVVAVIAIVAVAHWCRDLTSLALGVAGVEVLLVATLMVLSALRHHFDALYGGYGVLALCFALVPLTARFVTADLQR